MTSARKALNGYERSLMPNNSSSSSATANASVAFPVFTLATAVLLILKLGGVGQFATLSWWWVFAPMLFGIGLGLFFLAVFAIIFLVVALRD